MCGRVSIENPKRISEVFNADPHDSFDFSPSYNIAPSENLPIVVCRDSKRVLSQAKWGLIPYWAKEDSFRSQLINARAETVDQKPAFKRAFKEQRCLVVVDGFFEWQKKDKTKQPYYISLNTEKPIAFAGLCDRSAEQGDLTCTIITTTPNDMIEPIHNRMPVILSPEEYDVWLNPKEKNFGLLKSLLNPCASSTLEAYQVSTYVNSPKNKDRKCIEPI